MSKHIGISCSYCLKFNFSGRRYKCLWCNEYNLCQTCYDDGLSDSDHTIDHPVQCLLTVLDFDLYYGGEDLETWFEPQSLTCPRCGRMGFTKATLLEHLTIEHTARSLLLVGCPICAGMGDQNYFTYDVASHLESIHRAKIPRRFVDLLTAGEVNNSSLIRKANMTTSSGDQMSLAPSTHDADYLIVEVVEGPRPCEPTTGHPNHLRTMSESSSSSSSTSSLFGAETTTDYVE